MPFEKDENEIGALWAKTSAKGNEFMSGTINGVDVVCFKAKPSPSGKGPAWRVLKSQPRDGARFDARDEQRKVKRAYNATSGTERDMTRDDDTTWG
jgi:uncharacterized protein (DUF736 family)